MVEGTEYGSAGPPSAEGPLGRGFGAALSEHPDPLEATAEVIGDVLERVGGKVDLAVLFVTVNHQAAFDQIAAAVQRLLQPRCLIGAVAVGVMGRDREVEARPGVSLWAAAGIGDVEPVRLVASRGAWAGLPDEAADGERLLLLIPDPFTFPVDRFIEDTAEAHPNLTVVGGLASAAHAEGGNRLLLGPTVYRSGAVGALLAVGAWAKPVVSQGCRPIGQPYTVTKGEGNLLAELGGRSALQRLQDLVTAASPEDRALLSQGIHVGRVIDERRLDFARGDFLIRGVIGADQQHGIIGVGDQVTVGSTVQFQVRDADSADEDLRALLAGRRAAAALIFTCNGRGEHLFGEPDHDARVVGELTGASALAGMFCAGEIGPVGARNFLHGYTASVVLFTTSSSGSGEDDSGE